MTDPVPCSRVAFVEEPAEDVDFGDGTGGAWLAREQTAEVTLADGEGTVEVTTC